MPHWPELAATPSVAAHSTQRPTQVHADPDPGGRDTTAAPGARLAVAAALAVTEHAHVDVGAQRERAQVRGRHQQAARAHERVVHQVAAAHLGAEPTSWGRFRKGLGSGLGFCLAAAERRRAAPDPPLHASTTHRDIRGCKRARHAGPMP